MAADRVIIGTLRSGDGLGLGGLRVELFRRSGVRTRGSGEPPEAEELVAGSRSRGDGRFAIPLPSPFEGDGGGRAHICVAVGAAGDDVAGEATVLVRTAWRPEPLSGDELVIVVPDPEVPTSRRPVLTSPRTRGALAGVGMRVATGTRQALFEATTAEIGRRVDRRRRGSDLARRLLGRRRAGDLDSGTYVPPGASAADRLDPVRRHGVERLAQLPSHGMRMHLAADEFDRLFPPGTDGPVSVPPWLVDQVIDIVGNGTGGSRWVDLLEQCRAERAATAFDPPSTDAQTGRTRDAHLGAQDQGSDAGDQPGSIDVGALLAVLFASDASADLPHRPDTAAVQAALASGLPPGPADTTAYYDFQQIQIAWQDVWTSALDQRAVSAVAALYEQVVDTVDPAVLDLDAIGADESAELRDLLDSITEAVSVAAGTPGLDPPPEVLAWLPDSADVWRHLSLDQQEWLRFLEWVDSDLYPFVKSFPFDLADSTTAAQLPIDAEWPEEWLESVYVNDIRNDEDWGLDSAQTFLGSISVPEDGNAVAPGLARLESLLTGLQAMLAEPYRFDIFVPDSSNYGLVTTLRQRWTPLQYQAGDLVASLPLAPGETRSIVTRQVVKTARSQREIEHSMSSRSGESTTIGRAQAEIVKKATSATNFAMTSQGSVAVKYGIVDASLSGGHTFGANQGADSAQTKQDLRETVSKAAQEYRDERTFEVSTSSDVTREHEERRTISNPNNELTVTYLLYELQRRFEVAARLQAVRPVVMVAFDVPAPHEIDEAWLVAHEWILRRVILDDSLLPALHQLTQGFAGEELGVEILRAQWDAQMRAVDSMRDNVELSSQVRDVARAALQIASVTVAGQDGLIKNLGQALFPSGAEAEDVVAAQQEAAQRGLEWAMEDLLSQRQRLEAAVTALERATDEYVAALRRRTDRRVAIDQLRVHVKENVLHYMQAIWAHEPPDQRYFRLYDLSVQFPQRDVAGTTATPVAGAAGSGARIAHSVPATPDVLASDLPHNTDVHFPLPYLGAPRKLHDIADLDDLVGFKGNYAVFPLREGNAITDYMAQQFLDSYVGVNDPDPFGEMPTTTQALALAECAWNRDGTTDEDRAQITSWLLDVMAAQSRVAQEVIVPTGQVFMEALTGAHPLLEDYKLAHRAVDVERALADMRSVQVDTLRRAARVAAGDLGDPDVEQRVEVVGTDPDVTVDVSRTTPPA
jgi:hypothetical protein